MQFIRRILSEVGIYWRTEMDNTRELDTYIFADSQLNYRFDVRLPYSEPSGLFDGAAESVWDVRTWHNIATGIVATRDYNYRTQIQEFKYCGVSFDGWKDKLCQFWEAKRDMISFSGLMVQKKSGGEGITVQLIKPGVIKLLRQLINL